MFHVKQTRCPNVAAIQPILRNRGHEQLGTDCIQFREAQTPALRIELRRQIVDQHHRWISQYCGKISNLCNRHGGHKQFRLAARERMLQGTPVDGESKICTVWPGLRITAQSITGEQGFTRIP